MQSYEIEIKSLLGSKENADALLSRMRTLDPNTKQIGSSKQLNHYFIDGSLERLLEGVKDLLSPQSQARFADLASKAKEFSVRTRDKDGKVMLVVKASVDDTTSANGISRIEFEEVVPLTLAELDERLLASGFVYQAKWSRAREEYECNGATICLDKNAGYGYVAEFEKVVDDASVVESVRDELRALMQRVGAQELPQERLERMFAHYNANWPEYYGTEKIFLIE